MAGCIKLPSVVIFCAAARTSKTVALIYQAQWISDTRFVRNFDLKLRIRTQQPGLNDVVLLTITLA